MSERAYKLGLIGLLLAAAIAFTALGEKPVGGVMLFVAAATLVFA